MGGCPDHECQKFGSASSAGWAFGEMGAGGKKGFIGEAFSNPASEESSFTAESKRYRRFKLWSRILFASKIYGSIVTRCIYHQVFLQHQGPHCCRWSFLNAMLALISATTSMLSKKLHCWELVYKMSTWKELPIGVRTRWFWWWKQKTSLSAAFKWSNFSKVVFDEIDHMAVSITRTEGS